MFVFKTIIWGTIFSFIALIAGPWIALQFDTSFPPIDIGALRYVGIALIVTGAPLALYCAAILFIPGAGRPAPYDAGGAFLIDGPYRYVRNPFLLGAIVTLIGETILMSRLVMIIYTFIFIWCVHFWVIFFEEPALHERFKREYDGYRKTVPRWLPSFRKYEPR